MSQLMRIQKLQQLAFGREEMASTNRNFFPDNLDETDHLSAHEIHTIANMDLPREGSIKQY